MVRKVLNLILGVAALSTVTRGNPPGVQGTATSSLHRRCDWKAYLGPRIPGLLPRQWEMEEAVNAVRAKFSGLGVEERFLPKIKFASEADAPVIVLIHGISETPAGVADLADAYHAQGYTVYSVLLSGHGLNPEAMKKATPQMWRKEVKEAIDLAATLGNKVIVGGYSMGGTLAVDAAYQNRKAVQGLVLHSPALRFASKVEKNVYGREYEGKDYSVDFDAEHPPENWDGYRYSLTPQKSILSYMEFAGEIQKRWESEAPLDIPIYIAYATKDNVADRAVTAKFMEKQNIPAGKKLPVDGRHYETAQPNEQKPQFFTSDLLTWIGRMAF